MVSDPWFKFSLFYLLTLSVPYLILISYLILIKPAIGRTLIPRYFRSIFEGGVTDMQIVMKFPKESIHSPTVTLDSENATIHTQHGKPNFKLGSYPPGDPMKEQIIKENTVFVATEGRLVLEFMLDELMRIKSWHFSTRQHHEMISRNLVAMQQAQGDMAMAEHMSKNITRQGLTNSTLNYLRVSFSLFFLSIVC